MSLDYDISHHLHCRLTLTSGRHIHLASLHQEKSGLIEGVPFADFNDRIVRGALARPATYGIQFPNTYLVPPARRDYLRVPGDMKGVRAMEIAIPSGCRSSPVSVFFDPPVPRGIPTRISPA